MTTTKMRVNVDTMSWEVPNPIVGQPPTSMTYTRGDVADVPDYVLAQKKIGQPDCEKTLAHYPPAPGTSMPRARWEPVLVDPQGAEDDVASAAAQRARISELEEELAKLRITTPPTPAPLTAATTPNEVVLTPSVTGVVLIPSADPPAEAAPPTAETGTKVAMEGLVTMNAGDLTRLLSDQPDLADAVEAAEQQRSAPRTAVLQAVARARQTRTQ